MTAFADNMSLIVCHGGNVPGRENCTFFQWAEFDDDGVPVWDKANYKKNKASDNSGAGDAAAPQICTRESTGVD